MKKVSEIKKEWLLENINNLQKVGKSKADVSRDLNVKPQFLNSLVHGKRGITDQFIDKFVTSYKINQIDLSGSLDSILNEPKNLYGVSRIPLVSVAAVGGFGNANFSIKQSDIKDYYIIPKFKERHIDFMIEISGSSMQPKYNSGDVVACTLIKESQFIQWNKAHVIATSEQGILVKRLRKGITQDCLLAVSDNKDYDPFEIPVNEITGLAIVVGVVRLE
jgi:phage repressor protein C with HTH and peptisase S24 domain